MTDEIQVTDLPDQLMAATYPKRVAFGQVAANIMDMINEVYAGVEGRGIDHTRDLQAHYLHVDGAMDMFVAVPVTAPFDDGDKIRCITHNPGRTARILHKGPFENLPRSFQQLHDYCQTEGLQEKPHTFEQYQADPPEDPALLETWVNIPVEES